jgi:hypothetical protein
MYYLPPTHLVSNRTANETFGACVGLGDEEGDQSLPVEDGQQHNRQKPYGFPVGLCRNSRYELGSALPCTVGGMFTENSYLALLLI